MPSFDERLASIGGTATTEAPSREPRSFDDRLAQLGEPTSQEYVARSQKAGVSVGRSVDEQTAILRDKGFSPDVMPQLISDYKQAQSKAKFAGEAPSTLEEFTRNYTPFVGDILDTKGHKAYYAAKQRIDSKQAKPEDYDAVARYEALKQFDEKTDASTVTGMIKGVGTIGKLFLEGAAVGRVMSGAGGLVGGRVGSFLEGTVAKNPAWSLANPAFRQAIATNAGRMALMTAGAPSFYVDEARTRNLDVGREPDDIRGYPGAFIHGYSNMLVLGSIGRLFKSPAGTLAGRLGRGIGLGVGEQQIADVGGGAWDEVVGEAWKTKTRYGALGDFARGDYGEGLHKLAVQTATFAAFGGLHEYGARLDRKEFEKAKVQVKDAAEFTSKEFNEAFTKHKKTGVSDEVAAERAAEEVSGKIEEKSAEAVKTEVPDRAPEKTPTSEAPKVVNKEPTAGGPGEVTPRTPETPTIVELPPEVAAEHEKIARNVYRDEYAAAKADGKPAAERMAIATKARNEWLAGAKGRWLAANAQPAKTPEPGIPATPEPPRIAQAEPAASPTVEPAKAEIAQPAASGEAVSAGKPPEAGQPAPVAPEPPKTQIIAQPSPRQVPATKAAPADRIIQAIDAHPDLPPAQKAEYKAATKAIFARMPKAVHDRIAAYLDSVEAFQDTHRLGMKVYEDLLSDPTITPEQRAQVEDSLDQVAAGTKVVGGSYTARLNKVYIDGKLSLKTNLHMGQYGKKIGEFIEAIEAHAHEYGHVLDGPLHELSKSQEWLDAWQKEIKLQSGDTVPSLTFYGHAKASEGFAEFSRLLYGTDIPTARIAKDFPLASKFFKDRGLWPPERGVGSVKKVELKEIFGERVPDDEKQPSHADIVKSEPVLERAPKIERSDREVHQRMARAAVAKVAKDHGLTDLELSILLARTEASGVEIARRSGKTRQAVSARQQNALSRLPADVADRIRQLFTPDEEGAMLSKAAEVGAKEAGQIVSSVSEGKLASVPAHRQKQLTRDAKENEYNKLVEEYAKAGPERKKVIEARLQEIGDKADFLAEPQLLDLSLDSAGRVLDRALGSDKSKEVKGWLRRQATAAGEMPAKGFEKMLEKDQTVQAYAQDVLHAANDLTKAVGGDWRAVPKEAIERMNAALQDKAVMATLSPEVRIPLTRMRNQIDVLSNKLIESGALSDAMVATFKENLGVYLTRQYRAFSDPKWFSTLKSTDEGVAIINRFKAWFAAEARKEGRMLTPEDLDAVVEQVLFNDTAHDNPVSFLTHSKLGAKDLGILTKRKEIPEPLRALWGEVKDPIANYAASVGRMANLLANHTFLAEVKKIGVAEGWLAPPGKARPGVSEKLSDAKDRRMGPLAGWHTTEPIRKAFEAHYHKEQLPEYMKAYMKVLGLTKYAKTVLSPIAHLRQTLGNVFFNIKQGHGISAEANRMIREMVKGTEDGRAYHRRLIELGIDFQSVLGGEFKSIAEDAMGSHDPFTMSTKITENSVSRWLKKGLDLFQKSYRYEDLIVKIHAFENEKARYAKAHPEWSKEQLEAKSSEIVQRTFPTYSRIPGGVKWLRRFPLIGPFVSFTSEIVRTTYQTAKLAREEMRDPATRDIGAKRVAGLLVSLSAFAAIGALSRSLSNVTLEEEDAMRRFLPEWNKDSNLLHLGRDKDGKPMVIDLGRTDPHSYLLEPLQAGLTGARSGTFGIYDTLEPALKPFIGEEIGTRTALDIARNKMERGGGEGEGKVYNPEAPVPTKTGQILGHVLKGIEPGLVDQILRTGGAAAGLSPKPGGKVRSVGEELLADVSGQRVTSVDAKESLHFAAKTYEERMKNAEREVNQLVTRNAQQGVRLKPEEVQAEFERGDSMRKQVFEDLMADVQAARMLGMNDGQISQELKKSGVSQEVIGAVLGGRFAPRKVGQVLQRR